ncbi:hypothetical protein [Streptomyces sp. NPDC058486]|uniref:hypothetical protein n=1 Tax=unclassified Streptomyces TaxID=2593676 RepID=UPI00364EAEB4
MTTAAHVPPGIAVIPVHAVWGAAAGLVGGIAMGIWMSVSEPMPDTAMITMAAGLLGSTDAFAGWLIHLSIALFAGTTFGALLGQFARRRPRPGLRRRLVNHRRPVDHARHHGHARLRMVTPVSPEPKSPLAARNARASEKAAKRYAAYSDGWSQAQKDTPDITFSEFAEQLGVSTRTLRRALADKVDA